MNLYILRHGLAGDHFAQGDDAKRPLTAKGKRRMAQIAEAMRAMKISFDVIISSPYTRARQTAEIVAHAFEADERLQLSDTLAPDGNVKDLIQCLKELNPRPEEVVLAGHEPYLSELISLLVCGNAGCSVLLKKGGLCKLSAEELKPGRCATLEWLLTPKQMRQMV